MENRAFVSFVFTLFFSASGISFDIDGSNDPRADAFPKAYGRGNIAVIEKKKEKKIDALFLRAFAGTRLTCQVISEYSFVRDFPDREPIVVVKSFSTEFRGFTMRRTVFARFPRRPPDKNISMEDLTDTSVQLSLTFIKNIFDDNNEMPSALISSVISAHV